mgnify:CR=1 FL=1
MFWGDRSTKILRKPVDSWDVFDAQYSYTFNGLVGDGDTILTIGANNLFDEDFLHILIFLSNPQLKFLWLEI